MSIEDTTDKKQDVKKLVLGNKNPPASLVRYLSEGRCVLFAGSGLSAWGKLPTWLELLREIVNKLGEEQLGSTEADTLVRLLDEGKLLEVADYCKEKLGQSLYNEVMTDKLKWNKTQVPEPHQIIVRLPFSAIVTTNYDKIMETAYIRLKAGFPRTLTHVDTESLGSLLFSGEFFILKAHGDIDRTDSLVLTTQDYRKIIHANPAFTEIFSAILLTKAILFIGYSLKDPDFRLLLDRQLTTFSGTVPERYALLARVSDVEREVLWRTARIRVITYQEHIEVLKFLQALETSVIRFTIERGQVEIEEKRDAPGR